MHDTMPQVDHWYRSSDGNTFEIVDINQDEGYIDIQYFDGVIDELMYNDWSQLLCIEVSAPEDWSGPFDDLVRDDMGDTEIPVRPDSYDKPWQQIDDYEM